MTPNRFRPAQPAAANFSLNTYRLRALAVASAAVLAQKVEAQLVTFNINHTTTGEGFFLNAMNGVTEPLGTAPGFRENDAWSQTDVRLFRFEFTSSPFTGGGNIRAIPIASASIALGGGCGYYMSPSSGWTAGGGYTQDSIQGSSSYGPTVYFGFKMSNQGSGTETYYGWGQIALSNTQATLVSITYSTIDNGSVLVGETAPIPEPAHAVALLAAGAAGIAMFRRRRREKAAAVAA